MRTKTQLELLRKLRHRNSAIKGFSLIELMITVVVMGLIASMAIPRFIGARDAAAGGAKIGEVVGSARQCSVYVISGGQGSQPTEGGVTCSTSTANVFSGTWSGTAAGLSCLNNTYTNGVNKASVTVATNGTMACALS